MLWSRIGAPLSNRMNRTNLGISVLCARVPGLAPAITKHFSPEFASVPLKTKVPRESLIRAPHSIFRHATVARQRENRARDRNCDRNAEPRLRPEIKKLIIVRALCYSQLSSRNNNPGIQATTAARAATATRCTPFMGTIRHPYQQGTVEFRYAHTMRTR